MATLRSCPLQGRSGAPELRLYPEPTGCPASHSWRVLERTATLALRLPWEGPGVALASSRLGSPLALEGAAPPDLEWGALVL